MPAISRSTWWWLAALAVVLLLPVIDLALPHAWTLTPLFPKIMVFAIVGLGLNVITGFAGLLNLGAAAFMAIGAYAYAILTCESYPFQIGFWPGIAAAALIAGLGGVLLALPTARLRGDYLAIVTLGFGEITTDVLKNLEPITKGTQGISPVPYPGLPGIAFDPASSAPVHYLYLALLLLVLWFCHLLRTSRLGRNLIALREDEIAARACGVDVARTALTAMTIGAALCGLGGALWASLFQSSNEPGTYDFQTSILVLCIVIVGGLGSSRGVLLGALIMAGFSAIVLDKLKDALARAGIGSDSNVLVQPNNWKFLLFGVALILVMRLRPGGLLPEQGREASR